MDDNEQTLFEQVQQIESRLEAVESYVEARGEQQITFPLDAPSQQIIGEFAGSNTSSGGGSTTFDITKPMGAITANSGGRGGLAPSTTFFWVVTALDASGNETYRSNEVSTTTGSPGISYSVVIVFHPYPGATNYKVYRAALSGQYQNAHVIPWTGAPGAILDDGSSTTTATPP